MISLLDQLQGPVVVPEPPSRYQENKVPPKFKGARARYRAFLQVPRSVKEVAAHMGYTYPGTLCSLKRMLGRKDVKRVARGKYVWRTGKGEQ